ncbi:MAG TPA: UDP-N-acetylmuramoyl-L-alanine--D-glutamate ligase [Solirubrobacteraceae bacterium]|jgi:UDP-N-acetylmuramoylalanine--D-glutamate ligase|nr:UDP-N-acetylmuramoyl-L-alanine--D-glutamate ligase [Solirubrobacteraceae bacterium]
MRFSELEDARVGVWGAGREIASLARRLNERLPGARIMVVALDGEAPRGALDALGASGAELVGPERAPAALSGCDVVVRSPGVSIHRPELRAVREAGVPITTATSLWLAERGGERVVGVTGTKGKSTTAALLAHLLRASGETALLAGNIGVPALELLDADPSATVVLELSSYQIADLERGPRVAVVTNIYREHLDWHGSTERYREEKLRLLDLPGVECCVLNGRDEVLRATAPRAPRVLQFGVPGGWDVEADGLCFRGAPMIEASALPLLGEHNMLNACAALTALQALDISPPPAAALRDFEPLEHRLQTVIDSDGVIWVDDSISTTPESAIAALDAFRGRPVVLLAGGQERDQDFSELAAAIARRAERPDAAAMLLAIPTTGPRLAGAALGAGTPPGLVQNASDLADAVTRAAALAREGGVVVLSPAAPSFDSFRDFVQRGERFRELAAATLAARRG